MVRVGSPGGRMTRGGSVRGGAGRSGRVWPSGVEQRARARRARWPVSDRELAGRPCPPAGLIDTPAGDRGADRPWCGRHTPAGVVARPRAWRGGEMGARRLGAGPCTGHADRLCGTGSRQRGMRGQSAPGRRGPIAKAGAVASTSATRRGGQRGGRARRGGFTSSQTPNSRRLRRGLHNRRYASGPAVDTPTGSFLTRSRHRPPPTRQRTHRGYRSVSFHYPLRDSSITPVWPG